MEYYDDIDPFEEEDYPFEEEDYSEFDPILHGEETVILNGDVWQIAVFVYDYGEIRVFHRQLEDSCWNGELPF